MYFWRDIYPIDHDRGAITASHKNRKHSSTMVRGRQLSKQSGFITWSSLWNFIKYICSIHLIRWELWKKFYSVFSSHVWNRSQSGNITSSLVMQLKFHRLMRTSYLVTPNWIPVRKVQMQLVTKCHLESKRHYRQGFRLQLFSVLLMWAFSSSYGRKCSEQVST